jgi:hypothetical protein
MLSWSWSWKLENGTLPELLELQLETPTSLLHEDLPRLVVAGLPDANDRAVWLNLVDISAGNPNLLSRVDRSRHDGSRSHDRSSDNRRRDYARADDRVSQNAANNPSDEPRPEMTTSSSPTAVVMVVHHRRRAMMHHRRRAMMHHRRRPPAEAAAMAEAATRAHVRSSEQCSCRQKSAKCKYKFLVHVCLSFLRFCGHVKIGHKTCKN